MKVRIYELYPSWKDVSSSRGRPTCPSEANPQAQKGCIASYCTALFPAPKSPAQSPATRIRAWKGKLRHHRRGPPGSPMEATAHASSAPKSPHRRPFTLGATFKSTEDSPGSPTRYTWRPKVHTPGRTTTGSVPVVRPARWFSEGLSSSPARWNVLAQPVVFSQRDFADGD